MYAFHSKQRSFVPSSFLEKKIKSKPYSLYRDLTSFTITRHTPYPLCHHASRPTSPPSTAPKVANEHSAAYSHLDSGAPYSDKRRTPILLWWPAVARFFFSGQPQAQISVSFLTLYICDDWFLFLVVLWNFQTFIPFTPHFSRFWWYRAMLYDFFFFNFTSPHFFQVLSYFLNSLHIWLLIIYHLIFK